MPVVKDTLRAIVRVGYDGRVSKTFRGPKAEERFANEVRVLRHLEARGCAFVPRLLDYHPDAVPVPYNHANVDSDEVLFYVGGDFTSRAGSGVGMGSITLHPGGFTHGPQPG